MKFKLLILGLLLSLCSTAQYKKLYARVGATLFSSQIKEGDVSSIVFPAITIAPGYTIVPGKDVSLSLTAPVSIGASTRSDAYLGVDLPAMLEAHFGSATGNQEKKSLGAMLGAGLAYTYSAASYDSYDKEKVSFGGYRVHGGISFGKYSTGNRFLIIFSYGQGLKDSRKEIYGIGLHMVMGYKR